VDKLLGLDVRIFECSNCSIKIDRDLNAAKNILKLGLDLGTERAFCREKTLLVSNVETSMLLSMKQDAINL
jgi:transposase